MRRRCERAGFADVTVTDRNPWYREVARGELERLKGRSTDRRGGGRRGLCRQEHTNLGSHAEGA